MAPPLVLKSFVYLFSRFFFMSMGCAKQWLSIWRPRASLTLWATLGPVPLNVKKRLDEKYP